jgi:hypothetical protein
MFKFLFNLVFLFLLSTSLFSQEAVSLFDLAKSGKVAKIQNLVNYGFVDVNEKCLEGKTALMYAAEYGNLRTIYTLLDLGAEVNEVDLNGNTALILAIKNAHPRAAIRLIRAGANTELVDSEMIANLQNSIADKNSVNDLLELMLGVDEAKVLNLVKEERDIVIKEKSRKMIISYTYAQDWAGPSDLELLDAFMDKVLLKLSSNESQEFNLALSMLTDEGVMSFLKTAQLYVYLDKMDAYPSYNQFLAVLDAYSRLNLVSKNPAYNTPKMMRIKSEQVSSLTRSIRSYRFK